MIVLKGMFGLNIKFNNELYSLFPIDVTARVCYYLIEFIFVHLFIRSSWFSGQDRYEKVVRDAARVDRICLRSITRIFLFHGRWCPCVSSLPFKNICSSGICILMIQCQYGWNMAIRKVH